jgi:hypothetical protein
MHLSDYGMNPEVSDSLVKSMQDLGIEYKYLKYYGEEQYFDGWVDNGDFVPHNRSSEKNEEVFAACSHVKRGGSWYARNGQMHWCGRSIRGCELGKIPLNEDDFLDIYTGTIEKRKEKLHKLLQQKCITACDYCNGNYGTDDRSKRYPAGEQL